MGGRVRREGGRVRGSWRGGGKEIDRRAAFPSATLADVFDLGAQGHRVDHGVVGRAEGHGLAGIAQLERDVQLSSARILRSLVVRPREQPPADADGVSVGNNERGWRGSGIAEGRTSRLTLPAVGL